MLMSQYTTGSQSISAEEKGHMQNSEGFVTLIYSVQSWFYPRYLLVLMWAIQQCMFS